MTKASVIVGDVRAVLERAHKGKGTHPHFLTAYQVLERLPASLRDQLIAEYGLPGEGAGVRRAAASIVMEALRSLGAEVEITYFDNEGAAFDVAGRQVRGGYPVCGLYRLRPPAEGEA